MATEPILNAPFIPGPPVMEPVVGVSDLRSRLHKHQQFASKLIDDKHDFIVYVPPMYEADPDRFYPVLYMQDGQNLFDPETSFIKGNYWRVGETADALILSGEVDPLVIVGIYNTGEHRVNEYTPVKDRRLGGGQADAYGQMLVEELCPFVAHKYRTLAGRENCGMAGSSLGGLVTMYLGLRYPDVFGKLAVMSPSVWWKSKAILTTVAQLRRNTGQRIWLDIGTNESKMALPDVRTLKAMLERKGWRQGRDLAYTEVQGGRHDESAWAERVGPMLRFLYAHQ